MSLTFSTITLFEIPIHVVTFDEALSFLQDSVSKQRRCFCVTLNPEIILHSLKNPSYKEVLHNADLSVADGTGLLWATGFLRSPRSLRFLRLLFPWMGARNSPLPKRVTGTDLMRELVGKYPTFRYFLLGASPEVNQKLSESLKRQGVKIVGNCSGTPDPVQDQELQTMINEAQPDILLVAFGAPQQEVWIARNLSFLPSVSVAMGVGGAFDFLSGEKKRSPLWLQKIGLEWLYRLCKQPSRWKRILRATVVFPWKILTSRKNPLG